MKSDKQVEKLDRLSSRFPYLFDATLGADAHLDPTLDNTPPRVMESLLRLLSSLFLAEALRRGAGDDRVVRFLDYELEEAPLRGWVELQRALLEERRVPFEEVFSLESKLEDLLQALNKRYLDYLERLLTQLGPTPPRDADPGLAGEFTDFLLTYFKSELRDDGSGVLRVVNRDREQGFRLQPLVRGGLSDLEVWSGVSSNGLVFHALATNSRREVQDPDLLAQFAELFLAAGAYRQALQTHQKLGRPDPSSRPPAVVYAIHCHRGRELCRQGKYAQAVVELERAIAVRSDLHLVHYQLAVAYARLNNHAKAIQILTRVVEDNPGLDRPYELLGDLLFGKGDIAAARRMYDKAFMANPYNRTVERKRSKLRDDSRQAEARPGSEPRPLESRPVAESRPEARVPAESPAASAPARASRIEGGSHATPTAAPAQDPTQELLIDLTKAAREGAFHPVLAREAEIASMIEILCCRTRSNPLLIGDPGVGKTAIVEELARRIVLGKVPPALADRKLYLMSVASLLAGAKFRGQFEERVLQLVTTLKSEACILFIDDIHTIVSAGMSKGGTLDTSSMLKPALVRGEIQVIGATTFDEYRANIEKDPSLVRSMQVVSVEEPVDADLNEILRAHARRLGQHHEVDLEDVDLFELSRLSRICLRERRLPDSAINVLDRAAARVRLRHLGQQDPASPAPAGEIVRVRRHDVAAVLSEVSGVPLARLSQSESERFLRMEEFLSARVVGQADAVNAVARVLRTTKLNFDLKAQRPDGVFLFVGPSGVGKTELARATAEFLFGDADKVIRIDMSEYMEKISSSRLIGTAPGYVGYNDQNQLTDQVRKSPYSLVLLDEIEKADAGMLNLFLQVFDAGRLTDGKGRTVHFDNTTIVMTSNIGTHLFSRNRAGYGGDGGARTDVGSGELMREVKRFFAPEFLNRIDEIVFFRPLDGADIRRIADLQLRELVARLGRRGVRLEIEDDVFELLASEGYSPEFGARSLHRVLRRRILDPMAELSLRADFATVTRVLVSAREGRVEVSLTIPGAGTLEPLELSAGSAGEVSLESAE